MNASTGFLGLLKNVQQTEESQYSALCPAHDDKVPSLSIGIGDDGQFLLYCHAGCTADEVVEALGLEMSDLFPGESSHSDQPMGDETYDYEAEDGELLFQVCRSHPKKFLQRKPDGKGGWEWSIKNARRVPYRLPELLAAAENIPVFIVEGEKDVESLCALGLIATCNSEGAGKWRSEFNIFFRGRDVVLLPDNDSQGRDHTKQVAGQLQSIARSVKVIDLPDLPPKGDVSDWLDNGNTKSDLLKLVEESSTWNENIDSGFVPFPTDVLPNPLAEYIYVAASALDCDESYVAVPLLSALAAAIGNTRRIQLKSTWYEPCVLWTVIVGESGTVKSPALELARHYHDRLQHIAFEAYEAKLKEFHQKKIQSDTDLSEWKKSKDRKKLPPLPPKEPVCARYFCSDTTVEALAPLLKDNPRGLLLIRDELAGWINGFDAYKSGGGTDVAHWLSIHGARSMTVDRKTGHKIIVNVRRASVSVTGSIQPLSLALSLGREHFENGLVARLLFCFPPRRQRRW
ncbi:MAG: DUF3987 domain-containing protein, partial [Planctomycetes bacterium]|nr:DUF3987 domain-containing protein [Planctomycetota bacterium]